MYFRIAYFIFGILFFCISGFMIFVSIRANEVLPPQTFLLIAITIMSFCLGYLHPQFKQKDERMRLIRQKGMYISYFASLVYYIILTVVIQLNFVTLTALQVLNILAALTIITVFLSWVVLSKIY